MDISRRMATIHPLVRGAETTMFETTEELQSVPELIALTKQA